MYNPTQFVLRFLISFLISFLLVVLFVHFYCPFTHANFMQKFFPTYIYIGLLFYFTTHLIMTEARSKRRVLPLVFIVKTCKGYSMEKWLQNGRFWERSSDQPTR